VQPKVKRSELDHLAKFYSLDAPGIESMFAVADARPTRAEGLQFLALCLRIAGVFSLAAGLIFFVAANWSRLAVFGRFALMELLLVGCAVVALLKPPPSILGRGALFLAFVATGALLALFGQTYQTGADVYELFLGWALLGLPLALAAQWSVTSAAWVLVFNTALLLYCGWQPSGGMLWILLGNRHFSPAYILLAACWLNLLLWLAAGWRNSPAVPGWVRRILVSAALSFCTWAGLVALFASDHFDYTREVDVTALLLSFVTMALVSVYAYRRRGDIFPLAITMGSFITVGFGCMVELFDSAEEGLILVCALWLIGTSTVGGRTLLSLMRRWRAEARS
jgi:uncharacterized membrane protein